MQRIVGTNLNLRNELRRLSKDLLKNLVSINSVNPDMDHNSDGECEISAFLEDALGSLGFSAEKQTVKRTANNRIRRQNVIAKIKLRSARRTSSSKTLMFNSHMDTVPVTGMSISPFSPNVKRGFLLGRGSADMKGGMVSSIIGCYSILRDDPKDLDGDILLAFVVGEETKSEGTECLLEKYYADSAIVCEPTGLKLGLAHKGFVQFNVEIFGKPAHGSVPELGVDAIEKTAKFICAVETKIKNELKRKKHPLVGSPTLQLSKISGGEAWNIVPSYCKVSMKRRNIPGESTKQVMQRFKSILNDIRNSETSRLQRTFRYKISKDYSRPGLETSDDEPIVSALQTAYSRIFRYRSEIVGLPFWTDAAILSNRGIDSVVVGPGNISDAHTKDEKIRLVEVYSAIDLYREAIKCYFSV